MSSSLLDPLICHKCSSGENLLVTSGFDGAIYTWDINKYQETQAEFKKGKTYILN